MEIIKEGFNKKCEIAIVIFWKKKKTLKENMEETDIRISLKKINKNYYNWKNLLSLKDNNVIKNHFFCGL